MEKWKSAHYVGVRCILCTFSVWSVFSYYFFLIFYGRADEEKWSHVESYFSYGRREATVVSGVESRPDLPRGCPITFNWLRKKRINGCVIAQSARVNPCYLRRRYAAARNRHSDTNRRRQKFKLNVNIFMHSTLRRYLTSFLHQENIHQPSVSL